MDGQNEQDGIGFGVLLGADFLLLVLLKENRQF
jgi:hypothetical protein